MPIPPLDKRGLRQALIALAAWGALVAIGMFLPTQRAWGFNHLSFASDATRIVMLVGVMTAVTCLFARYRGVSVFTRLESRWGGVIMTATVGLLATVLYSREALLGDGTLRAKDAMRLVSTLPSEILPTLAATTIAQIAPTEWGIDGYAILRFISIVSGVLMVGALWRLIPKAMGRESRAILFWILTFGTVRLMAGYVESYTTAFAGFTLWTLAAWGYYNHRIGSTWMVVCWILAMLSHVTAVFLLPATVWLLIRDRPVRRRNVLYAAGMGVLAVGVLLAFYRSQVNISGISTGHFFITLFSDSPHNYGLLSMAHLLDMLNHWLLIAPAMCVVGLTLAIDWLTQPRHDVRTGTEATRHGTHVWFWALAAGLPAVMGFVIDPKLGWARDWDLYALLYSPALVGAALWLEQLDGPLRRAAMSVAVLSAALWMSFSVDGQAEVRRFEALLELDPSRSDYGHEILAQRYRREGQFEDALRHYRAALFVSENARYRLNIAAAYAQQHKYDDAERWYRGVIGRDSLNAAAYYGLSLVMSESGRRDEALAPAVRAHSLEPGNPDYVFRRGAALLDLKHAVDALPYLEESLRLSPKDASVNNALAVCYLDLNRLEQAHSVIQTALRIDPTEAMIWLNAARISFARADYPAVAEYLSQYETRIAQGKLAPEAVMMRDSLEQIQGGQR